MFNSLNVLTVLIGAMFFLNNTVLSAYNENDDGMEPGFRYIQYKIENFTENIYIFETSGIPDMATKVKGHIFNKNGVVGKPLILSSGEFYFLPDRSDTNRNIMKIKIIPEMHHTSLNLNKTLYYYTGKEVFKNDLPEFDFCIDQDYSGCKKMRFKGSVLIFYCKYRFNESNLNISIFNKNSKLEI